MRLFLFSLVATLITSGCATQTHVAEHKTPSPFAYSARQPASEDTNCVKVGADKDLVSIYSRAVSAWCQDDSKATYMLETLLTAAHANKADFYSGSVFTPEGFIALALGGYKLHTGMEWADASGQEYISVHFVNTDPKNTQVKFYESTFKVSPGVIIGPLPKK